MMLTECISEYLLGWACFHPSQLSPLQIWGWIRGLSANRWCQQTLHERFLQHPNLFLPAVAIHLYASSYLPGLSVIEPEWLPVFAPSRCQFSKPMEDPSPRYQLSSGCVLCHRTATCGKPRLIFSFREDTIRWNNQFCSCHRSTLLAHCSGGAGVPSWSGSLPMVCSILPRGQSVSSLGIICIDPPHSSSDHGQNLG